MPRDNEKKACPTAVINILGFRVLTSNVNINFNPSAAPFKVIDLIANIIRSINSPGIRILLIFSIPCDTPFNITNATNDKNIK